MAMSNLEANQRSSDHCHLSNRAFKLIAEAVAKKIGRTLERWVGPEIVTEDGTYKLDWHAPDGPDLALSDEAITLYEDGVWQFYGKDGQIEGRILRLHDRRWIQKMIDDDVIGVIAHGAVHFFKSLKKK
jgi:hypothetical protein